MSPTIKDQLLDIVTDHYFASREFNGITADVLVKRTRSAWADLVPPLKELLAEELIGAIFPGNVGNIHVNLFGFDPENEQLTKLDVPEMPYVCFYPHPKHLCAIVDRSKYSETPYLLALALGTPTLEYRVFEPTVLEYYLNDPRYRVRSNDISGTIWVGSDAPGAEMMQERDQIFLQSFGFAFDKELNRVVAVYLWRLANLSKEHQQLWKARELAGSYHLQPDFYRTSILAQPETKRPVFTAFLEELYLVNRMSQAMGRPPLFRHEYGQFGENKPPHFSFLLRPTLRAFQGFVSLLDRLISDNINRDFFMDEVPYNEEVPRKDGSVEVRPIGTLNLLDTWVRSHFPSMDLREWEEALVAFREIRRLRQRPAHAVDEDQFDTKYHSDQRSLIIRAYRGMRTLRVLLSTDPSVSAAGIVVPDMLRDGAIWEF